ncbi:hypothetical protein [Viridibacillus arvi]|uniref:hypothetical protein n=1 Tax=Viridibacillus arvi TaxID=263475 RepID=UPI003CFE81CA
MKKLVGFLIALVIILGGLWSFNLRDDSKGVMENNKDYKESVLNTLENHEQPDFESYQFKDIESMEKAETLEEAFDKIFGNERLFDGDMDGGVITIEMKPDYDTRREMIDFLHFIQYSDLIGSELDEKTGIVNMQVVKPIKPGMNRPEAHQKWAIHVDQVKIMDFRDKETMLDEISLYGKYEDEGQDLVDDY